MAGGINETSDTIVGATDGTEIGNVGDRLKVDVSEGSPQSISRTDFDGTATETGATDALETSGFGTISFQIEVTAASGTSPTLDVELQSSEDGVIWEPFVSIKRFTTTGSDRATRIAIGGRYYRYRYVIGGSSPSFTFNIKTTLKPYMVTGISVLIRYADVDLTGQNTSTIFNARGNANVSLMTRRDDDGGSNSQFVVEVSMNGIQWNSITGNISQARDTTITQSFSGVAFKFWRIRVTSTANTGVRVLDVYWQSNGGS